MSKFTPGPWEVDTSGYRAPGGGLCVMGGALCVAVIGGDSYKPQAENARLIAAAPEMLEALQAMVDAHAIPSSICKERPVYEAALAAILKATAD